MARTRGIEMPTRERILSLIRILDSFSRNTPIRKKDLLILLRYEYENYIYRQLLKLLHSSDMSRDDIGSAEELVYLLTESNDARFMELRDDITAAYDIRHRHTDRSESIYKESILSDDEMSHITGELLSVSEGASFDKLPVKERRALSSEFTRLTGIVRDIRADQLTCWVSPLTLITDLAVLTDQDYDFARTVKGSKGIRKNSKGYYGNWRDRRLSLWQLKLLFESVVNNQFLQYEEIENITEAILLLTDKADYDKARSICHELVRDYYTKSSQFRDNLEQLIDLQFARHMIAFDYVRATVTRGEYIRDPRSPITVFPIDIVFKDNHYYLLGGVDGEVRTYRVDRIRALADKGPASGSMLSDPDYALEKSLFYRNNTNNFSGGESVRVVVRWDFSMQRHYTALMDIFGYENISQGDAPDEFMIRTRDNDGMYQNLLRLGPVIEVLGPPEVREKYIGRLRRMSDKYKKTEAAASDSEQ